VTLLGLMRHFPTDWNHAQRLQGRVDRPLTDDARERLKSLRPGPPWDAARVIASPLSRARDTAEALWPEIDLDARLVETAWGEWEGLRGKDLLADSQSGYVHVENWGWNRRPPCGESPADVWARIAPALAEIAADGRRTLLVIHRGVMRVILARAYGWNYDSPEPFVIRRARIYPLTLTPDGAPTLPLPPDALLKR